MHNALQSEAPARRRPFRYRRTLLVAAPPAEVWATIGRVGDYPTWWPWLRYRQEPAALARGTAVRAVISPPLPYALHLVCWVDTIDPGRSIQVTVGGDLVGPARVDVDTHPGGSSVTLTWDLRPDRLLLEVLAGLGRPLLAWGHEWVIATGAVQFQRATGLQVSWSEDEAEEKRRWPAAASLVGAAAVAAVGAAAVRRRAR